MASTLEIILTIIGMGFWILFPIGMFLSVSHVDKNTDQIIQLQKHKHMPVEELKPNVPAYRPVPFDWHHPVIFFRRWLQHD